MRTSTDGGPVSTARRSAPPSPGPWAGDHAGRPLVVDVRSLPPLTGSLMPLPPMPVPPPVEAQDLGGPELVVDTWHGPAEVREPTFDELVRGHARHRGAVAAVRRGL